MSRKRSRPKASPSPQSTPLQCPGTRARPSPSACMRPGSIGCQAGSRLQPDRDQFAPAGSGWMVPRVPRPCAAAPTCHLVRGKCHADTMQLELDRSPPARRPRRFACAVPRGSRKRTCASAPRHRHAHRPIVVPRRYTETRPHDKPKLPNHECKLRAMHMHRTALYYYFYTGELQRTRVSSRTTHHTHTSPPTGSTAHVPDQNGKVGLPLSQLFPAAFPFLSSLLQLFDFADQPTTQMS